MNNIKSFFKKDNLTYFNIDSILFMLLFFISVFGIFILYSATNHSLEHVEKQFYRIIFGFLVMVMVSKIPASAIRVFTPHFFIVTILLLIAVVFFGSTSNGAKRWLNLGFFMFQPSELAKLTVPMFLAFYIEKSSILKNKVNLLMVIIVLLVPTSLILIQPDLGTSLLIFFTGFVVLFVGGFPFLYIWYSCLLIIGIFPLLWLYIIKDYQKDRILTMFNPEVDPLGGGYHIIQSKISVGSGGVFGQGWLEGIQSHLAYVPEQHTDFIFSVIGEELGLMGFLTLSALYFGIIMRVFYLAKRINAMFYKLTIVGLISAVVFYIFVNIGMVTGVLPVVGLPLPFISYGGSSLLILFLIFGIISSFSSDNVRK